MSARLALRGLQVHAGTRRLLGPLDLDLAPGQCLGLVGESGSGKSLTVLSLLGLLVQMVGAYAVTPAWAAFGPAGLAMPALLLLVAVALLLYARRAREGGWLR